MKHFILTFFILFPLTAWGVRDLAEASESFQKIKKLKVKSVSDLSRLSPFRDVVVIQKRYLPKTFRGEAGLSLTGLLNNKFFISGGLNGQLGFFVREQFGFGISGMVFGRVLRIVSTDLIEANGTFPFTNVQARYYGGGYFKWNPFYGKFAFSFLKDRVVYFDMFFLLGGGIVYVTKGTGKELEEAIEHFRQNSRSAKAQREVNPNVYYAPEKNWRPAGMFGLGQTFALNKNWGIEWNLRWIISGGKIVHTDKEVAQKNGHPLEKEHFSTDMHLSIGVNYYFPGVKYR